MAELKTISDEMAWYQTDTHAVLSALDAMPDVGLTSDEVDKRLQRYGTNMLSKRRPEGPLHLPPGRIGQGAETPVSP